MSKDMPAFGSTTAYVRKRRGVQPLRGQASAWDDQRLTLEDSVELTRQSLLTYGARYKHWCIAYSGGKDSTATVTLVLHLIETGQVSRPETLTVLYSDTRQEIPPLHIAALATIEALRAHGVDARVIQPPLDDRYFVYMFGFGVPPPNNRTLRWCTAQLKIEPMDAELWVISWDLNKQRLLALWVALTTQLWRIAEVLISSLEKFLLLTGVRIGESAARDERIAVSCGRNGAECGQGWLQVQPPAAASDVLAPLLHWRVCHVWDWLTFHAPAIAASAALVAEVYGGDEALEMGARTGCIGCPLAEDDTALDYVISQPDWSYLEPLKRLRPLYRELRRFKWRLQKDGERNKDGNYSANPSRKGPLTMDARRMALRTVIDVQREINRAARQLGRRRISLINWEEFKRIRELIRSNTWPQRWSGDEPRGDVLIPQTYHSGARQELLFTLE